MPLCQVSIWKLYVPACKSGKALGSNNQLVVF